MDKETTCDQKAPLKLEVETSDKDSNSHNHGFYSTETTMEAIVDDRKLKYLAQPIKSEEEALAPRPEMRPRQGLNTYDEKAITHNGRSMNHVKTHPPISAWTKLKWFVIGAVTAVMVATLLSTNGHIEAKAFARHQQCKTIRQHCRNKI